MIPGRRNIRTVLFALSLMLMACEQPANPAQLGALDNLISATDAAMLTLNELDRGRYDRSDSLFASQQAAFSDRFRDTLGRDAAQALGAQFVTLRSAAVMGNEHERVLTEIAANLERLRKLREDIATGALEASQSAPYLKEEQQRHTAAIEAVHRVIDNYKLIQHAWDRRDTVDLLLADTNPMTP